MSSAAGSLSEPQVLAHTKRRLFPGDTDGSYVVADTQFSQDEWLPGEPIDSSVRDRLAPFNHVRIGGGYPDLVGVGNLESELLAVDRLGDEPPLIAIEAKGYTSSGVDTELGIVQAYDRLHEANAAYFAAPVGVVSETDRTLARELNVGVLGVDAAGNVEALEVPRVVGNRTTTEARALRFQAGTQGVADASFGLNHPKNYLGYVLAHYADGDTATLLSEYRVVSAVEDAKRGAAFLGLIEDGPRVDLTSLGEEVIRFATARYGSVESALEEFEQWHGSPKRFVDLAPAWGRLARRVVFDYEATALLVRELQAMDDEGITEPSLVDTVVWLHEHYPSFTVELFVRGDDDVRRRVLTKDGELRRPALEDGEVYHSPTVFQLKAMLYHAGILTDRGAEPSTLEPTADVWALREPV
ncbi:hypothetical protein [Natronobacterium gregoryi]|uniref:Uncharacterized protein n=2 Tax=Natronobacterium gregoryi TaxID=44930 RepID=L0AJT4_NATGS|nr:hypothetical protein [Natronobacterium gregoryi]AFZ73447.1 hypothetical protein Natgr_2271 [Natronobacterium gregoryi SP2]ELY68644.1 hypothetical protein C490_09508 [Natronobacterium gregoryi SP2]PLK20483.1 hypothetical protein CYV19_09420 [Natronobacterium gregoryi SP2]SFI71713.1 hypothetical protein SAMN05443661_10455 [Natronobacterium gregoryi]